MRQSKKDIEEMFQNQGGAGSVGLQDDGAEFIINISASPWTFGKNSARDRRVLFLKEESGEYFVPFFYVNCTGVQNNGKNIITFDGGSTVYNKEGFPIFFAKQAYKQELMVVDEKELRNKSEERVEKPKVEQKYLALINGIKYFKEMTGFKEHPNVVIGLSGGIDSSVVAALLVKAIGKEKVIGVNMPTKFNSEKTKSAAKCLAEKLMIKYAIIPIESLVDENVRLLEEADVCSEGKKLSSLNLENVQAKIRGTTILSNFAAKYDGVFTNNGNKNEVFLGYATLYGDVGGAFAPIGDMTKTEVVELARYINEEVFKSEVIPSVLLPDELWNFSKNQIEPSAELKEKQVDPIKFGYHCALVDMATDYKKVNSVDLMKWYLDGCLHERLDEHLKEGFGLKLMKRYNIVGPKVFIEDLEEFFSKLEKSVFKRVQSPPIIITSKSSFGYDIRESMLPPICSKEHEKLKKEILRLNVYPGLK